MNVQVEFLNDPQPPPDIFPKRVLKWFWFHFKRSITPAHTLADHARQIYSFALMVVLTNVLLIVPILVLVMLELAFR